MHTSLYDLDTEQETFQILRAQNKKIQDLFSEIECKDELIANLKSNLTKISEYENLLGNYQRQISRLNEKIIFLENSVNEHHNRSDDNLRYAQELQSQIKGKDQIILEHTETLKQYEVQMSKLKKDINDKQNLITKGKNDNEDLKINIKNYLLKIHLFEEEIKLLRKEKEDLEKNTNSQKFQFEDKAEQLVDLIKLQNTELNTMSNKIAKLESENSALKNTNYKYTREIDELVLNLNEFKESLKNLRQTEGRVKECEGMISDLQNVIETEKKKNSELMNSIDDFKERVQEFNKKCSTLEETRETLKLKDEEISNLNRQIESLRDFLRSKDNSFKEIENEVSNYVNYVNVNMLTCLKWADTYLGIYINPNTNSGKSILSEYSNNNNPIINLSALNLNTKFLSNKAKVNFDFFSENLLKIQKRLNSELHEYEESIQELKSENSLFTEKVQNLLNENSLLKEAKLSITEDNLVKTEVFSRMKKDLEYFKEKQEVTEKKKNEIENCYIVFLSNISKDFKSAFENLKQISKISDKTQFLYTNAHQTQMNNQMNNLYDNANNGIGIQLRDQVRDCLDNLIVILNFLSSEYQISLAKLDDLQKIKIDCEQIKKQFEEYKKTCASDLDLSRKENSEKIKFLENSKFNELKTLEEFYKSKLESSKNNLIEKEEFIGKLSNEYELLKGQLSFVENNFESHKNSKKDYEKEIKKKSEELEDTNKQLEKKITKLSSEIEIKDFNIKNLELTISKKSSQK